MKLNAPQEEINKSYENWKSKFRFETPMEYDKIKEWINKELEFFKNMSVEEYTLYKKWYEINKKWGHRANKNVSLFFGKDPEVIEVKYVKNKIWIPESPEDYNDLDIELIYTKDKCDEKYGFNLIWNILRVFGSSMYFSSNPGRNLFFIVRDKKTKKYLGVLQFSSDFMDLTLRDNYIGWSRDYRTNSGRLNHTTIGSTIVPTQPLGYNYLGGKLLALLCASDIVANKWKEIYENELVGITTTSLYGSFSQYNSLKYWKKCGHSKGTASFEPSKELKNEMYKWLAWNDPYEYYLQKVYITEFGLSNRSLLMRAKENLFKKFGYKKEIQTSFERGVYFCGLYENTNQFLRGEIEERDLKPRFDNKVESLVELWKEKYAKKRIENLKKNNKINMNILFYDDMLYMDWEETKEKYLKNVGR